MKLRRGFTLIELLTVIAIIGILAAIILASLSTAQAKGRDAKRISDIKQLQLALELYNDANNGYPGSGTLSPINSVLTTLAPNYISILPTDPSNSAGTVSCGGSNYLYCYEGTNGDDPATVCSTAPCAGYVLFANLETGGQQSTTADPPIPSGVSCTDGSSAPYPYCQTN